MNGMMGWLVAAVVIIAAGVFYFWPQLSKAPVTQTPSEQMQQMATTTAEDSAMMENKTMLTGTWRSNTDAKFTREFRADGVIYDRYEGDATPGMGGSWSVVTNLSAETALTVPPTSLMGKTVIKAVWNDEADTTYFSVNDLTDKSMTVVDLSGRGGATVFTKI